MASETNPVEIVLINPGGRRKVYQGLGTDLTAIEPPLWCRLIGGYLRDRDIPLSILDSEALEMDPDDIAQAVGEIAPRLVVIVVFGHQPSASTQQMVGARMAAEALKEQHPDLPLLIVGGHVSALPERTVEEEPVDFACKGEGPATVEALLYELRKDPEEQDLTTVPGLVHMVDGKAVINAPAELVKDLDKDLHGNVWDMLPMERYRAHNWQCFGELDSRKPYASIYTTLGCPYKCVFCCINAPFDINRYRMRSPKAVVDEIELLRRTYGVRTFKIVDEMFVLKERHYMAIVDDIIARGLDDLNFWAYARVDTVKPATLERMRKAGFRWLALGIESGSKHVRDGADKALKYDDIVAVVHEIQKANIHVIGNFIFGLPDDDAQSMSETLELAKDLNCEFANFYSAMAYPGSPLYGLALQNDWPLPEDWSGYSQHSYDCKPLPTEKVSAAEVLAFRDSAFHDYFSNTRYLDMVTQRFGVDTRTHVEEMAKHRLSRKLVEEAGLAAE